MQIVGHRTSLQLHQVSIVYQQSFGKNLIEKFESETKGEFGSLLRQRF